MTSGKRTRHLVGLAGAVAAVSAGTWVVGQVLSLRLLSFAGLMVGASTFIPLPADAFVLAASAHHPAPVVALIGGVINTVMVLVERSWIGLLVDHRSFNRFVAFFENNRLVDLTGRHLFLSLIIGGASLVPFEPFRLVAVMRNYPLGRYATATFLARSGRYYTIALVGEVLVRVGALTQAVWLFLTLFVIALVRSGAKLVALYRGSPR